MNSYSVSVIFNILCTDEDYDDFNVVDFHDDTKAVFLNYIKETFWDDLALCIDSKLEKIDNIDIMKYGIKINACISSSENAEEIDSYIEAISEKSIWQCVLQYEKTGDEIYNVFDEINQKSFHFHYISDIYVENNISTNI